MGESSGAGDGDGDREGGQGEDGGDGAVVRVASLRYDPAAYVAAMRCSSLIILSFAVLFALAACTASQDPEQTFTSAAQELGYECHETAPPAGSPKEMISCADGANEVILVIFANVQARKAGEGLFISIQSFVEYGDRWLIAGSSPADLAELREHVQG